ncbi:hypothetical protein ACTWP5_24270 [Streptomyces sp. 4N509B]|uniref:hypothetical protein n=1 Tax=Streptomyces sp. 4N509B TaxID=3457413 RepID=UPI003FD58D8D
MIIAPEWLAGQTATLPTGEHFDAIRLAQHHGEDALALLTRFGLVSRIGPIVADHDQWYVLLPAGSDDEPWPDIVHYLAHGATVAGPPPQSDASDPAGLRWIRTLMDAGSRWVSDPSIWRTAVEVVATTLTAPTNSPGP